MTIEFKEWAIPIRFEGVELSPLAIVIDHLGNAREPAWNHPLDKMRTNERI